MLDPEFWRRYFKVYDVLNVLPTYTQLLSIVCEELEPMEGDLILDAGSGTGNLSLRMVENGSNVVALDYCLQALERHRMKGNNCYLILADLRIKLPFRDNCFDKIGSNNMLYTLTADDQQYTLKEIYRILKPDGKVVLANPKTGWNPMRIYIEGLQDNIKAEGFWKTIKKAAKVTIPTIKMFYYNGKLKKESQYHCFLHDEQKELLKNIGFRVVSETRTVYADQHVLNSGYK